MGQPHKHAEIIKAWVDGAKVQWRNNATEAWKDLSCADDYPSIGWYESYEYRIKPEEKKPVKRWLWAYKPTALSSWYQGTHFCTEAEAALNYADTSAFTKIPYTETEFPE